MADVFPMAHVTATGLVELQYRPVPKPGEQEVLIQVRAVGLCGSDLHIFRGRHPAAPLPVAVGHEISGQVLEVGSQVQQVQPGDRVAVEPVIACGRCFFCQRGWYHQCTEISFQYRRGQGGLATRFCAHERWVHKLPEQVGFVEGALLEPLAVALHALGRSELGLAQSCVIFGAGAVGLLLLQAARLAGSEPVLVVDVRPFRLQKALALGASAALDNRQAGLLEHIRSFTAGLGAEVVFEAVGLPLTLQQSLQAVRKGGRVVLAGLFEQPEVSLPANIFVQKEISLLGTQGYNWDFQRGIALLAARRIDLLGLVTHTFPLEQVQKAFDVLADGQAEAIKIVVEIGE